MIELERKITAQSFRRRVGKSNWDWLELELNYRDEKGFYNPKLRLSTDPFLLWVHLSERIAQYPCLNEEIWSEMELEEFYESWDGWLRRDLACKLNSLLKIEIDETDETDDTLLELFRALEGKNSEYYEPGVGVCLEKLTKGVDVADLFDPDIDFTTEEGVPSAAIAAYSLKFDADLNICREVLDDFMRRGYESEIRKALIVVNENPIN